jgi:hypothetical protein
MLGAASGSLYRAYGFQAVSAERLEFHQCKRRPPAQRPRQRAQTESGQRVTRGEDLYRESGFRPQTLLGAREPVCAAANIAPRRLLSAPPNQSTEVDELNRQPQSDMLLARQACLLRSITLSSSS